MIWLSKKLGKHQTFVLSCVVNAVLLPCFFFLPKGEIVPAIVLFMLLGLNMSAGPFLFRAIMADVADHDHAETGEARAGVYFSLLALTNKLGYSCAIFLSYALLAYVGFSRQGQQFAGGGVEHDVHVRRSADADLARDRLGDVAFPDR